MKGITQRTYDGFRNDWNQPTQSVRLISDSEVHDIYETRFWNRAGCPELPWPLCLCHFDSAVNHGPGRAQKFLALTRDPLTYLGLRESFYRKLAKHPDRRKFLKGWLNRVSALRQHLEVA